MPRKSAVKLDLSALAGAAAVTTAKLVQTRTPSEKVASELAPLVQKSFDDQVAVQLPATPETVKAIVAVLRRDAAILGMGVRLKTVGEPVTGLEFMGRPKVTRTRKSKS